MNTLWQDIRFSLRMLVKNPGFSLVVVLTLAVGIGGSTAVFSILNVMLLHPLPYHEPDRLVQIWTVPTAFGPHQERSEFANVADWKRYSTAFEDFAVYDPLSCLFTGEGISEKVSAVRTTANLFSLLGMPPILGRTFTAEEAARRERVIVLSYDFWQQRYTGDPDILGKTVEIEGQPSEIIGVMPQHFWEDAAFWEPHTLFPDWDEREIRRGVGSWFVVGRLKQDHKLEQAQTEIENIAARLATEYPNSNQGLGASLTPLSESVTSPNFRLAIWILFGAVIFVLLIGCANLVNMLLVRGVIRQKEFATRLALGASPNHLIRQLLIESLPLCLICGATGIWIADILIQVLHVQTDNRIPRLAEAGLDPLVIGFAIGLTGLVNLVFGIIPGIQLFHTKVNDSLKEGLRSVGSSKQTALQNNLVIAEIALATLLLFGAGLFIRSFQTIQAIDPGFKTTSLLTMNIRLPQSKSSEETISFCNELSRQLHAAPGIQDAGLVEDIFGGSNVGTSIEVEGEIEKPGNADFSQLRLDSISPTYFNTIGVPLLKGRFFNEFDRSDTPPVAIINEAMASRYWYGQDPIGKKIRFPNPETESNWITVTGVVRDMRRESLEKTAIPQMFLPLAQNPSRNMELLINTSSNPLGLAGHVRELIHSIDISVAAYGISTLENKMGASLLERRFQTSLLSAFSIVALLLAGIGIYGIVHYSVQQRTQEIAIRISLGATFSDVLALVFRQAVKPGLLGIGIGIGLGLAVSQFIQHLLFEVQPADPITPVSVSFLLIVVTMAACYIPARRAGTADPMTALRYE